MTHTKPLLILLFTALTAHADFQTTAAVSSPIVGKNRAEVAVGMYTLPDVPPAGAVRVEMKCAQICQTDRRALAGKKKSDVILREIVLGHEGVGKISALSEDAERMGFQIGDYAVVLPHYVPAQDEMLLRGTPNLSPQMQHLGLQLNGVFANHMDFPAYNIFSIPKAETFIKEFGEDTYLQQMVNTEPLACVQRGYKLLEQKAPEFLSIRKPRILILGAGPMGLIHVLHARKKYKNAEIFIYDPHPTRQSLAAGVLGSRHILKSLDGSQNGFDLVATVTSSREANVKTAIDVVKNEGTVLIFSGINSEPGQTFPTVGEIEIESVHRTEGVATGVVGNTNKTVNFVGTSGYTKDDVITSISELNQDLRANRQYSQITTSRIDGLENHLVEDLTGGNRNLTFDRPAIAELLSFESEEVFNHEKVMVQMRSCRELLSQ